MINTLAHPFSGNDAELAAVRAEQPDRDGEYSHLLVCRRNKQMYNSMCHDLHEVWGV